MKKKVISYGKGFNNMQHTSKMLIIKGNIEILEICTRELNKINQLLEKSSLLKLKELNIKFNYYASIAERLIDENRALRKGEVNDK